MYQRVHHIIVLDEDPLERYRAMAALEERQYVVLPAATLAQARECFEQWPIDLLVTAARAGGMTGVQILLAARSHHQELAGVIVGDDEDRAMDMDAWRHGARLIVRPYDRAAFLMTVAEAIASIRRRQRWPRKPVTSEVPVTVAGSPAALIDVSYGGLRFAVGRESYDLPSPIPVDLPWARLRVHAELVWSARASDGVSSLCGAAIVDDAAADQWRRFVDRVPQPA